MSPLTNFSLGQREDQLTDGKVKSFKGNLDFFKGNLDFPVAI